MNINELSCLLLIYSVLHIKKITSTQPCFNPSAIMKAYLMWI